ncbi:carboxylating nicotinate-nucleotide diphosphorylase [Bacillus sp. ISL-35]|uniref:carboxylating nicotinate-nucleotide diphosphorylase n=1 Tax=Bacillus sp. ISL-35 TaxID=2819122 RepID=UPI001BEBD6BD|nr:carboxylating nicotinate-nucleotide diphosphorylase [Bacillus sp. ISL-35]MBT2681681.1 carboxylating nicotinate-nucleotide diphosphorylase [Bacillus sp. ISL-35]MBT2702283.1 carboxylating nicotinate-nucleotide diphosphorylase [Chryseobacterium sp. ISL-80]
MNSIKLRLLLEQFFIEDIGERDVTSELIFGNDARGTLVFIAKDEGVFCGEQIIDQGFRLMDENSQVAMKVKDGEKVGKGQELALITGKVSALLKAERVVLNLVQRMSGIATKTNEAVKALDSMKTRICDTRKTTPGLRMLEKYAVRCGGGFNHRYGLYDAVMIKDNHISFAGSISKAVEAVRSNLGHMVKVEVEIETKEQLLEAIEAKADCIMFDNRTPEQIEEWIGYVPEGITTEASGGITLDTLHSFRNCGVDYISLGFLTHSVKSLDISAKVMAETKGDVQYEYIGGARS